MNILDILRLEASRLRKDESGVALMLTLSVFLLLYVICAGIYSIGETVRQKVELQNACDSAAYSAAVVQADGLSRMAMINRAMAWTYIQLTNMQIDYITYKWLGLVVKRFGEDSEMCGNFNHANFGGSRMLCIPPFHEHRCADCADLSQPVGDYSGSGWFCGVAGIGMDLVRINAADDPVRIDDLRAVLSSADMAATVAAYGGMIDTFKGLIAAYHLNLCEVQSNMLASIEQTATATLYENLPRKADGSVDSLLGQDFVGHIAMTYPTDPYNGGGGYFSPLYNNELGERIFLTMADGEVYSELADYFDGGNYDDWQHRYGGLDQWFVRSYPSEASLDSPSFAKQEYESLVSNSIKARGISRCYKNTNRRGELTAVNGRTITYRDHHNAVGSGDMTPSCINTHVNCPEQCLAARDSVALYADYEWSSGQFNCDCTHIHHYELSDDPCDIHFHTYGINFLSSCQRHQCWIPAGVSHSRSSYLSCVANGKGLDIPDTPTSLGGGWPSVMFLDCGGNPSGLSLPYMPILYSAFLPLIGEGFFGSVSDANWNDIKIAARYSNKYKPNGFSRIYGDDREIFDSRYSGAVAMPLVLNASFYGREGAIVVGLARKQRNPWSFLLNAVSDVVGSEDTQESGVYSAFNPQKDNWLVTFSAARAAHRYHPSAMAVAKAAEIGYPLDVYPIDGAVAPAGEYEVRFDAVCEEGMFSVVSTKAGYSDVHVGCVCQNPVSLAYGATAARKNMARLARCWNLCETDWDATLLPLRFARAAPGGILFDSLNQSAGVSNAWEIVGVDSQGLNPLENAAKLVDDNNLKRWFRFYDASGELQLGENQVKQSGAFVSAREPQAGARTKVTSYDAPYGTVDIEEAECTDGAGKLDLKSAIQFRIL